MTDASATPDTSDASFVTTTRTFYDAIAEDYQARFRTVLADSPLDRALMAAFAELVGPDGQVADLGCGPGRVTAHLASLGLRVFGLDLSASMLAIARRENPGLRFEQGSMLELDLPDGALAGAVSWYSSIHTPWERLPDLFGEIARVLAPGGHLLLGFQVGDEPSLLDRPFGHPVALEFQRRRPEAMAGLLEGSGFTVLSRTVRTQEEDSSAKIPQACLIARR
ncbi:methyltransferase domain-containing protein [Streptomyces parvulus]|uniref:class I SAM-dependent methyltransferase n=1 Tax=Streptomyces parvulus TaxID=146923 RepID=UPI001E41513B|nr:class I SAM-dependent methyltransferase [Streptomyces parvulus]MCC9155783.1 methyltransferase domain-containing protein [Streptomyces parvulus]MCE7687937.1 methyltransferase domain-containing protein [Streptomyces parvulus]